MTSSGHLQQDSSGLPSQEPPARRRSKKTWVVGGVGALIAMGIIGSAIDGDKDSAAASATSSSSSVPTSSVVASTEAAAATTPSATPAPAPVTTTVAPPPPAAPVTPDMTPGQANAVKSAQNYLKFMPFSRQGLIDQLSSEYGDKYSVEDATFAVDHLQVDWNEQAVKAAQNYLDMMPFSRQGLIDQLSSEYGDKYTVEQATHAVDQVGL